ncbi:TPR repeat region-containing protein [Gordonia soli]|uniref:TPR repeat domain-containing protein n=1 Tax=Gordonia soli NBRC 108243 TaxID=1223545 RepID=M0QHU4_9ACTN|nr:hypothetical protein [Gordonia soli]GAC66987.1 hypothetical protein GS4_05_02000 [Gordonia soli NBRC 108243]
MTIPTRTIIDSLNLSGMTGAQTKATSYASFVHDNAANLRTTITELDWSGGARKSADSRADREYTQFGRVSSAFTKLSAAISSGHTSMSHISGRLKERTAGYEADSYTVSDDWKVKDGYNYGLADFFAAGDPVKEKRLADLKAARAQHATNATVAMTRLAREFGTADDKCAAAVRAASAALHLNAPVSAGVGAGVGHRVAAALREGRRLTPDELTSLRVATSLNQDQLTALQHGKPATMSQGEYDFLRTLMNDLGTSDVTEIAKMGVGDQSEAVKTSLANGFQIMGMPGMTTAAGDRGGMHTLPTSVRSLLTENLVGRRFDRMVVVAPGVPGRPEHGVAVKRIDELTALSGLLDKSDHDYRVGSDVNRGLLKQASEIAAQTAEPGARISDSSEVLGAKGGNANTILGKVFGVAGADKIAVHDFLTGTNMNVTCSDGGRYVADTHIDGIMGHAWGTEKQSIDDLFSWTRDDALSPNHFLAGQAHASANALAHYFGDGSNVSIGQEVGVKSPHLAQTLSTALSPYLGGFSGAVGPGIPTLGADSLTAGELHNLFQAMDSDPHAAAIFNHAGSQWQNHLAYQYGMNPDNPSIGRAAGLIHHAMETGYADELKFLKKSAYQDSVADYENKMGAFSQAVAGIGTIPLVGSYAAAAIPPQLAAALLGPAPDQDTASNSSTEGLKGIGVATLNDREILQISQFLGYAHQNPAIAEQNPQWFNGDQLTWEFLQKNPLQLSALQNMMVKLSNGELEGWDTAFDIGAGKPPIGGIPMNPRNAPVP